ncbi:MAG TPA: phage major capsid protein, partial [Brevibacterium sp.]|nr:phage major capsid protein [Brevibacterium sp.]
DREMSMGVDASGGYAVPEEFLDTFLEVAPQEAIVRPRATVIPAGSNPDAPVEMVALDQGSDANMYGGVTVEWIAEGEEKPETDFRIRPVGLAPQEVAGHIVVTDKLLRNWGASGALIERQLRGALIAAEDVAFLGGSGSGKPLGPLFAGAAGPPALPKPGAVIEINRAAANQISYADIVTMYARAKHGGSLEWVTSQTTLPQLMQMKDEAGQPLWQPNARDGAPGTLLGLPVRLNERSPQLGARGDLLLVDWQYYLIKDGVGPIVAASPHVHFVNNKTVVKAFKTVDARPWLTEPIMTEGGYTVSPFVVLDVPSGG